MTDQYEFSKEIFVFYKKAESSVDTHLQNETVQREPIRKRRRLLDYDFDNIRKSKRQKQNINYRSVYLQFFLYLIYYSIIHLISGVESFGITN